MEEFLLNICLSTRFFQKFVVKFKVVRKFIFIEGILFKLDAKNRLRNFCIIAHVDHGKSTLADRILEKTNSVSKRDLKEQLLDDMDLEREKGITIKARAVKLKYIAEDGLEYEFNLIDTPGHVDFNYEVSRSLAACDGAILIVDASQGVQAQTLANAYLAIDNNLDILPVINKVDLPQADVEMAKQQIEDIIGIPASDAPLISAKTGLGIEYVLEAIVNRLPCPEGDSTKPLKALIFDSYYDSYKGVIVYVRIKEGKVLPGDVIKFMATGKEFVVVETGFMSATELINNSGLFAGDVGFITAAIKNIGDTKVGDTVTLANFPAAEPLPGYRKASSMVYSGIYPARGDDYEDLKIALEKLQLNDAALNFEPEDSEALGFGFRCGFLGLLHMEIVGERLEREYNLEIITTAPSVEYRVTLKDGSVHMVSNPSSFPDPSKILDSEEPVVKATILTPSEFVGSVMELCESRRGIFQNMQYLDKTRVEVIYILPLGEIIYDFFDSLKSRTKGYASLDYIPDGFSNAKLVKLNILLAGQVVDALSFILHADNAYSKGRKLVEKLKENIPRQLFEVPVQAAIGSKIIARETVRALKKDVLAKCYGGDITRKKKLLEKQKEGKKRMRRFGSVEVPAEAFAAILKLDD